MKIKTIDITAKEWFDRVNGNSYFSARVVLNFGMKTERTIYLPFQYGYGDQYRYETRNTLQEQKLMPGAPGSGSLWQFCEDNKIILRANKIEKCLKRDVNEWGTAN